MPRHPPCARSSLTYSKAHALRVWCCLAPFQVFVKNGAHLLIVRLSLHAPFQLANWNGAYRIACSIGKVLGAVNPPSGLIAGPNRPLDVGVWRQRLNPIQVHRPDAQADDTVLHQIALEATRVR